MENSYYEAFYNHCENQMFGFPISDGSNIELDQHQYEAMMEMCIALEELRTNFSIVHSCGSGKTILETNLLLASQKAKDDVDKENYIDIFLTPERALLFSIRDRLNEMGLDVGVWGAGQKKLDRPIILSTIQTLQRNDLRSFNSIFHQFFHGHAAVHYGMRDNTIPCFTKNCQFCSAHRCNREHGRHRPVRVRRHNFHRPGIRNRSECQSAGHRCSDGVTCIHWCSRGAHGRPGDDDDHFAGRGLAAGGRGNYPRR